MAAAGFKPEWGALCCRRLQTGIPADLGYVLQVLEISKLVEKAFKVCICAEMRSLLRFGCCLQVCHALGINDNDMICALPRMVFQTPMGLLHLQRALMQETCLAHPHDVQQFTVLLARLDVAYLAGVIVVCLQEQRTVLLVASKAKVG